MSFINSIIKVFVGDKSQKDVKATQPYINKIKALEPSIAKLSNDELIQLKPLNYFSIEILHNILTKLYHNFNAFNISENKYIDEIENF